MATVSTSRPVDRVGAVPIEFAPLLGKVSALLVTAAVAGYVASDRMAGAIPAGGARLALAFLLHQAPVTIVEVGPGWEQPIASMLADLRANGDERWFHPFALDETSARSIASASGRDRFLIAIEEEAVLALGMLRGWDEGYDTPSLGIAVRPGARGRGIGRALMLRLHEEARHSGSHRIRLTVDRANVRAVRLYASLGYVFSDDAGDRLTGFLEITGA